MLQVSFPTIRLRVFLQLFEQNGLARQPREFFFRIWNKIPSLVICKGPYLIYQGLFAERSGKPKENL